jgi:diacylglycerol kinase family enzyme
MARAEEEPLAPVTDSRRIVWQEADPPLRPVLFVNPRSGGGKASRAGIAESTRERGIEVIELSPDLELTTLVDKALARGADALGVAGGDGSLAIVAAAARAYDVPFICVPAGTRNHFARDLGLDPDDPLRAVDAFDDGKEARIDLAEVNGRAFVNSVSLGVYGEAVQRVGYRDAKLRTLAETARVNLGPSGEIPALDLIDDLGAEHSRPAVVLVSNNPYGLTPPREHGARPVLDSGRLGVIVIDAPADGRPPRGRAWSAPSLEVGAPATLHAGVDGEAVELRPPLRFSIRPTALRVRVPRRAGDRLRPRRAARARFR